MVILWEIHLYLVSMPDLKQHRHQRFERRVCRAWHEWGRQHQVKSQTQFYPVDLSKSRSVQVSHVSSKSPSQRQGYCWEKRKGKVSHRRGVNDLPSRQISDIFTKWKQKKMELEARPGQYQSLRVRHRHRKIFRHCTSHADRSSH